ncbi:hypothetical protein L9F63_003502, partial [Diploptera punctata]
LKCSLLMRTFTNLCVKLFLFYMVETCCFNTIISVCTFPVPFFLSYPFISI